MVGLYYSFSEIKQFIFNDYAFSHLSNNFGLYFACSNACRKIYFPNRRTDLRCYRAVDASTPHPL